MTATTPPSSAPAAAAPSVPLWRTQLGTYLGLAIVLAGMVALFSWLSEYFWSAETFITIANEIPALAVSVTERADAAVEAFAPHEAIAAVWELVDALNGYITEQEPWALAKDESARERLGTVLATALRGLGTVNVLVSPVMPKATEKLWASIGAGGSVTEQRVDRAYEWQGAATVVPLGSGLFPRIEQQPEQGAA